MSVYFIACGGFIKIGFSDDPQRRVKNLFRSSSRYAAPRAAFEARDSRQLIGYIEGEKDAERRLHLALDDFAAGCEWFVDEPTLREYLAGLPVDDPDQSFVRLAREDGPVRESLTFGDQGGGNYELVIAVWKRSHEDARETRMAAAS